MYRQIAEKILRQHLPLNDSAKAFFRLLHRQRWLAEQGLEWLVRFCYAEPLFRSQCAHVGTELWMEQLPDLGGGGQLYLGNHVRLSGKPSFRFSRKYDPSPIIRIGDGCFIGHNVNMIAAQSITLGRYCLVANSSFIVDNDGHALDALRRRHNEPAPAESIKPVEIGDDVWIGRGAIILKGVHLGDRVVVGAGAVVSHDVAADCIVAGNPAQVVS